MHCLLKACEQPATHSKQLSRDGLVATHLPLVKYLVDRIASSLPPHLDKDDLRSTGTIGLISAAERFDPNRGVQFKTFAEQHIRGAIIDELRAQDWLTRGQREKVKRLEKECSRLEQRLQRNPTSEEIAHAMGLSLDEYYGILEEVHYLSIVSLDDDWNAETGESFGLLDVLVDKKASDAQAQMIERQTVGQLAEAIDALPEKERTVITLYYHEELNLKEIGEVLDLTESRISQLHSQAIVRLRGRVRGAI